MVRQSAFQQLSQVHQDLADLVMITKIEADPEETARLVARLDLSLRRHFEVEEQELYPTLLEAVDDWEDRSVLLGALEGRQIIMILLRQLKETPPEDERLRGKVHLLDQLWARHSSDEEDLLYDLAHRYLDGPGVTALNKRIRKAAHADGVDKESPPPPEPRGKDTYRKRP